MSGAETMGGRWASLRGRRVIVTGAGGFIGEALCDRLHTAGAEVWALGRRAPQADWHWIPADLGSGRKIEFPGEASAVFHLASRAHALAEDPAEEALYRKTNVDGTGEVLEAAARAGIPRFVYFSTVKAHGESTGPSPVGEEVPPRPLTPYGRTKLEAEGLVLGHEGIAEPVVLRPPMVYGPTTKGNLPRMILAAARGRFPPLPETGARRSMLHREDAVDAALLAATQPHRGRKAYFVTDGHAYSTRQIHAWICRELGRHPPRWSVPLPLLRLAGWCGDAIGRLRGRRWAIDSASLAKLLESALYRHDSFTADYGYRPTRDLESSLRDLVPWVLESSRPAADVSSE